MTERSLGIARGFTVFTGVLIVTLTVVPGLLVPRVAQSESRESSFEAWLGEYRRTLREAGFSSSVLRRALDAVSPLEKVLARDEDQPEFTVDFERYSGWFLTEKMVRKGKCLGRQHAADLRNVAEKYGVSPRFILSIWGIESRYGTRGNEYPVVRSLATLVYGSERSEYFDRQLRVLLRVLENHPVQPDQLRGSWAGALGQPQFMPSSYRDYAVDFDADGLADIWTSHIDVFASIANYLKRNGWRSGQGWGYPLPPDSEVDDGRVIEPDSRENQRFRVYENFDVLMSYNPSHHYALTVGLLADRIGLLENTRLDSDQQGDEPSSDCASRTGRRSLGGTGNSADEERRFNRADLPV